MIHVIILHWIRRKVFQPLRVHAQCERFWGLSWWPECPQCYELYISYSVTQTASFKGPLDQIRKVLIFISKTRQRGTNGLRMSTIKVNKKAFNRDWEGITKDSIFRLQTIRSKLCRKHEYQFWDQSNYLNSFVCFLGNEYETIETSIPNEVWSP